MKETGLMFKAPLVRAILSGQKTQTRRPVKWKDLQKGLNLGFSGLRATETASGWVLESNSRTSSEWRCKPTPCPQGQAGDRIYVRETWCQQADDDGFLLNGAYWYRATTPDVMHSEDMEKSPWRPSILMPKAAARIWLEVTSVRVERLQSISEEDAEAEGVDFLRSVPDADETLTAKQLFECLWGSTGGDWAANPWVWVIDFKRIERTQAQKECTP